MATFIESALQILEIDINLYKSVELRKPTRSRGVFGGQVVGQCLMAAMKTVSSDFSVHSLHSYFLKPGNPEVPIIYHVSRVRDGKSFCTRIITAKQKGEAIFTCEASFHVAESSTMNHQWTKPITPSPETFPTRNQLFSKFIQDPKTPALLADYLKKEIELPFPMDVRYTKELSLAHFLKPEKMHPPKQTSQPLSDDMRLHQCVAAYATDLLLLSTSLLPFGMTLTSPKLGLIASLDHCIWFHEPFRADEWMLYEMESPKAASGRGFTLGRLFTQDGRLVVSSAQEGVIRMQSKI